MIRKITEYLAQRKADKEYREAVEFLQSPDLFSQDMRVALKEMFPALWTHMDNFSQDEIFRIAFTMTMLGYKCDSPAKLKTVMDILVVQKIVSEYPSNPSVLKRCG